MNSLGYRDRDAAGMHGAHCTLAAYEHQHDQQIHLQNYNSCPQPAATSNFSFRFIPKPAQLFRKLQSNLPDTLQRSSQDGNLVTCKLLKRFLLSFLYDSL